MANEKRGNLPPRMEKPFQMTQTKPAKTPRPDTHCENPACGKRISPGRHGRRRYCNKACKQAAWRYRNLVTPANGKGNTTVTEQARI